MTYVQNKNDWGRFDFLGISKYITVTSIGLVVFAVGLIAVKGLTYGVDFSGGIEVQVQFNKDIEPEKVRSFMTDIGFPKANVQSLGHNSEYIIHIESMTGATDEETNKNIAATVEKMKTQLTEKFAGDGAEIRQVNTVGPQVGKELKKNGMLAAFYCFLLVLVYIGLRFDYRYAPAAVFCLFHDAVITVGIYSLFNWDFTVQTMAAVLTIVGYSLNDTIVIFDRIRENTAVYRDKDLYWISNRSINETLSRTLLTYILTYFTVVAMYVFADGVIQDFALTMMIGMFLGVFSTIYIATPLMLFADHLQKVKRQRVQRAAYSGGK